MEFLALARRRSINDQLLEWLDIARNSRSNVNDDNRDDHSDGGICPWLRF